MKSIPCLNGSKGSANLDHKEVTLKHQHHGIMVTLKFLKKIRDKLDDYIEEREQARELRRSCNLSTSSSWCPEPSMEERTRRKSNDDGYRRYTSPDPVNHNTIVANNESRAKKKTRSNQQFNSEDDLVNPRRSRDAVLNQRGSGRERSPRRSDSVLARKRPDYQRQAGRLSDDNEPRASNERMNRPRQNIPALPLNLVQWAGLPRNNRPLSPQAVPPFGQQSYSITDTRQAQPSADWDTYVRGRNKKKRLAAAEKRTSDDRVKRENERRRLLAFGPPPGECEQQPPQHTWSTPHILSDSGSQARPAERSESASVQARTAADNNRQLHILEEIKNTVGQNSVPVTPQKDNSVQNVPPEFTPLTENLRAQAASGDEDLDPLGRGLGDNMRTVLEGFRLPTIFESDLTPSDEEENPLDQK